VVNAVGATAIKSINAVTKAIGLSKDFQIDENFVSDLTSNLSTKISTSLDNFKANTGDLGNGLVDFIRDANVRMGKATVFMADLTKEALGVFSKKTDDEKAFEEMIHKMRQLEGISGALGFKDTVSDKDMKEYKNVKAEATRLAMKLKNNKEFQKNSGFANDANDLIDPKKIAKREKEELINTKIKAYKKAKDAKEAVDKTDVNYVRLQKEESQKAKELLSIKNIGHGRQSLVTELKKSVSDSSEKNIAQDKLIRAKSTLKSRSEKKVAKEDKLAKLEGIQEALNSESIMRKAWAKTQLAFMAENEESLAKDIETAKRRLKTQNEIVDGNKRLVDELENVIFSLSSLDPSIIKPTIPTDSNVSGSYYDVLGKVESNNNYNANRTNSNGEKSAYYGKYQFRSSTAKPFLDKIGKTWQDYKSDPKVQDAVVKMETEQNRKGLTKSGFKDTDLNLWIAHNQGLGGARQILRGKVSDKVRNNMAENIHDKSLAVTPQNFINFWSKKFSSTNVTRTNKKEVIKPTKANIKHLETQKTLSKRELNETDKLYLKLYDKEDLKERLSDKDLSNYSPALLSAMKEKYKRLTNKKEVIKPTKANIKQSYTTANTPEPKRIKEEKKTIKKTIDVDSDKKVNQAEKIEVSPLDASTKALEKIAKSLAMKPKEDVIIKVNFPNHSLNNINSEFTV